MDLGLLARASRPVDGRRRWIAALRGQRLQPTERSRTIGAIAARLFGEEPELQLREDLCRFKQMLEAGEIPTMRGQPSERRSLMVRLTREGRLS